MSKNSSPSKPPHTSQPSHAPSPSSLAESAFAAEAAEMQEESQELTGANGPASHLPDLRTTMELGVVRGSGPLKPPYLQIAYGVGELSKKFNPGDLVINGVKIASRDAPVPAILMGSSPYFKESLTKDQRNAGLKPRSFRNEAAAKEAGLSTEWVKGTQGKRIPAQAGPASVFWLLLRKPADCSAEASALYVFKIGEHLYTPVVFDVDKSSYWRAGKTFEDKTALYLVGKPSYSIFWALKTEIQDINGNATTVAVSAMGAALNEAELNDIQAVVNALGMGD